MHHDGPAYVRSPDERLAQPSSLSLPTLEVPRGSAGEQSGNAGILFGQYVRYVAKIGGTILGRSDEVDDVIQDVFLAVHHDLHNLRDPECTKAWIATIAVRVSRQHLAQRSTRRRISEIPPFELQALAAPPVSPEHSADLSGMLQVMQALPPLYRAAWLLKHVDHQPLERIAALSSCSESTAQRRIRAAESSIRVAAALSPQMSPQMRPVVARRRAELVR
jgi:RNA polymerase sigma-70 factor (ECF subfamily)